MSTDRSSDTLRQHRPLLLACEAIGWLHMAGKAKADFLRGHGGQPNAYKYERWFEFENPPFPWSDLLQWVRDKYPLGSSAWPSSLTDFVTKHTMRDPGLLGLLQAGHAMASGIEKNLPSSTSEYLSQDATHMWLTSPFGHPVRNLLADPPQLLTEKGWQNLLRNIRKLLEDLQALGDPLNSPNDLDGWWQWRESAIGPCGWLRKAFLSTLAETRLPNNEVTLWDQSYIAAALFKAAVAGAVLLGNSFNWKEVKQQTRWRVLTVGFGAEHYEARALKIGDWVGARRDIEKFFEQVRRLIEVDIAVGSLVYRDDETLAFTFPGLRLDANDKNTKGSLDNIKAEQLRGEIEQQIDQLAQCHKFEIPPLCQLSTSTRSFVPMVAELRKARDELAIPIHRKWPIPEQSDQSKQDIRHVCPVCQVRLNQARPNDKTDNVRKSRVCAVCESRRKGRLDAWLQGEEDTIWIDEVADHNDRVALLSFSLTIDPWIEGKHVDSLRIQSIPEWRRFNPMLQDKDNPICQSSPREALLSYIKSKLGSFNNKDSVLKSLQDGYRYEKSWKSFYEKIVEDRAYAPPWGALSNEKRTNWLVHQLFRKLPSPGRIYRFWRAAEEFFDKLLADFRQIVATHENRWRTRRLLLYLDSASHNQNWEDRGTYSGRFGDAPFELLYLDKEKAFITICNIARCLQAIEAEDTLIGRALELRSEEDPQTMQLTVKQVKTPDLLGVYAPIIPLERSPQRFRVLVPLDRAKQCIDAAITKWKVEFGRVWDRMPLHIGMVAFPRMTSFQAVIEAARNLEVSLVDSSSEMWRVKGAHTWDGITVLLLEREDRGCELVLVPIHLSNGRPDVFYPYVRVQDPKMLHERDFQHPEGQVFRHVEDLRIGDGIYVDPSRIAAVFLDTTARRFERPSLRYLSDFERMRETWRLLRESVPSITALRGAWAEMEARQVDWRDTDGKWLPEAEEQLVELSRSIFSSRLGISGTKLQTLVDAARSGIVEWAIEWHLRWLKEK